MEQVDRRASHERQPIQRAGSVDRSEAGDDGDEALAALIRAVARGDDAAFREIYRLRSSRLYGIALRITRQQPMALDAVQDAFLEVWRNASRFDRRRGTADFWLASLVRYRAIDMTRRLTREIPSDDLPEAMDEEPDVLSRMVASSDTAALRACLETLEPERRRLLTMAFIDGLSHSELSQRLNVPIGSVKSWIRRSLLSLRSCMGGEA